LTVNTIPVSGTYGIEFELGGIFFTDIYYGQAPILEEFTSLSGGSPVFNVVQLQKGSTFNQGSLILGSASPSGVLQVFDLDARIVLEVHEIPEILQDNVEDIS